MIKNIFLPEKIGTYYLFSKRIVGIDIGKTHIGATIIQIKGNKTVVEQCLEYPIEFSSNHSSFEQVEITLKKIINELPSYDELHTTVASSVVVFKELKLPFTQREKIALIINFEVESLLPFSLDDAVIDFIITKEIPEEKSSLVMVACVQKKYILEHLSLFESVGIAPDVITVDLFALYGLYRLIPTQQYNGLVFLDCGFNTTRIAYLYEQQLRLIRIIPQGISHLIKSIAEGLKISAQDALEMLMRYGVENSTEETVSAPIHRVIQESMISFLKSINFTLSSFLNQMDTSPLDHIILFGGGAQIKGINSFATDILQIPCSVFDMTMISRIPQVIIKNGVTLSLKNCMSLSAAFPAPITENFNLRAGALQVHKTSLLLKQLISMIVLTLLLFGMFITQYVIQTRKLKHEIVSSTQELIKTLKAQFKGIDKNDTDLEDIITTAQKEVDKEKETWFAFSYANQARCLQYLLELTTKIDKKSLGFEVSKITIAEGIMTLKAQVRDGDALTLLERELRTSPLFSVVPSQDLPNFTMNITLAPTTEEL